MASEAGWEPMAGTQVASSGEGDGALSVTEATAKIRAAISMVPDADRLLVRGEVSNYAGPNRTGHHYFSLKDEGALLKCVAWRSHRFTFPFENGLSVVIRGKLDLYPPSGSYQLVAQRIELAGAGALMRIISERAAKLRAEGLFAQEKKRQLPVLPRKVAIVTSLSAAALRDVLTIATRRAPNLPLVIVPAAVQGPQAPHEIVAALRAVQADPLVDVVLLVRGGGSFEDLAAFQDEEVVRTVAACRVPVVTGVGHESDTTLVDYAADCRAPTPSAAAELSIPVIALLKSDVDDRARRVRVALLESVRAKRSVLERTTHHLHRESPERRVSTYRQDLDIRQQRLMSATLGVANVQKLALLRYEQRLAQRSPAGQISLAVAKLSARTSDLRVQMERLVTHARSRHAHSQIRLEALSPLAILARGYTVTRDAGNGAIITRSGELQKGQQITTVWHDGTVESSVISVSKPAPPDGPTP